MAPDLFDPAALTASLPNLLPHNRRKLESQQDAITALVHTSFHVLSFRLVAVDDSTPPSNTLEGVLPDSWNSHGPGSYTLRYRHEQSSLEFVVKVVKLGSRTRRIPPPLIHGYISSNRVADFLDQLKLKIIQNLMPGLHKEGYTEGPPATSPSSSNPRRDVPGPRDPARPQPILPPYGPEHIFGEPSSRNPLEIGRRDLDPLGVNPLGGFGPPPLFPGSGGDGMFVGPNHPIFGQRGRGVFPPNRGPWGGDGYLPPMGAPPGARFDPVGSGTGTIPGGGQPGSGNVGDPDNDEFMPAGNDMFM
ncbi:hypothetical protein EDB83DRAFT_2484756 [Lactarius deliciosus]|nr:hypothetical protein EDB83DRAFT_2484756 [Lactarius deliciosus]